MTQEIFKDFPQIKNNLIYFDTAAMSLKPQVVVDEVNYYNRDLSSNINRGMYESSLRATTLYEEARIAVAKFINARENEIVFTRGTTASLNLVAMSYGLNNLDKNAEILVSEQEHHSQFLPWQNVAKKTHAKLKFIELDETGRITIENFKKALTKKTKIVAINYVSNVLGFINPVKEMISLAHEVGALVVLDAAQAIQHLPIDVLDLDVDFLAFSGHKMLGPTGIGVLFGKIKLLRSLEPIEFGGDMNEVVEKDSSSWKYAPHKFEAGTMPIAGVLGLTKAIDYLKNLGFKKIKEITDELYSYLFEQLKTIPEVTIYNGGSDTGIVTFNLGNIPAHDAITYYALKNIALRSGQHCAKLIHDFLGIHSSLRASVYIYNTKADVDMFIKTTKEALVYFKKLGF
ncbi:MAG: SufS family cysteine desulfurase [Candidatus Izemoplasmatales bacterium]